MKPESKENVSLAPNVVKPSFRSPSNKILTNLNRVIVHPDASLCKSQYSSRSFLHTPKAPDECNPIKHRKKSIVTVNIPSLVVEPDFTVLNNPDLQSVSFDSSNNTLENNKNSYSYSHRKLSMASPAIIKLQFPKSHKLNECKNRFKPPLSCRILTTQIGENSTETKRSSKTLRDLTNSSLDEKRKLYEKNMKSHRSQSVNDELSISQNKIKPDSFFGQNKVKILDRILGKVKKTSITPFNYPFINK